MDFNPETVTIEGETLRDRLDRVLGPQRLWLHVLLFIATFFTCCVAGVSWKGTSDPTDLTNLGEGVAYALLILAFLSAHEFGHFIAARIHGVDATLPFYIPTRSEQVRSISGPSAP